MARLTLPWRFRKARHKNPVRAGEFRLSRLTDNPWPDYIGGRDWCDAKQHPCGVCGGRCCACRHTERKEAVH